MINAQGNNADHLKEKKKKDKAIDVMFEDSSL